MLEVRNLVKKYLISKKSKTKTVTALNNVSITFPETGLIFLLGKSGSGKSTLLNAIGGLDTFDSGEIIIKGRSSRDFSQADFDSYRNTFIGFIFQEYNVLEEFTVAKNLELAIELQGKPATKEKVNELLELVEMQEFAKRKPNQLSGGQKQRVAIARALIKNPEIIMADEPTGALDSNTGKQVMETLKNLSKEKLVIIVSHDREFAEIYGDRIIELKDGRIIRDVTKKEVEPVKTESGISIIDDDVIHIKKGQKFTQEDVNKIFKSILEKSAESDVIISMNDEANREIKKATSITDDGNREVFKDTTSEDVKTLEYSKSDFKLIKSRLKFKDSFKMGASALKTKVGKLVFTILLSFLAFAMFGIIDTLAAFNRPQAVYSTIKEFGRDYVSIIKEKEGEYSNMAQIFTDKDIEILNEKFPDIQTKKVVGKNISFGQGYYSSIYQNKLYFNDLSSEASVDLKSPFSSGKLYLTADEMTSLGLQLVRGRLPQENSLVKEACITKYQYECLKALNTDKITSYDDILNTYNTFRIYSEYNGDYKIVGIIDDGKDMSVYLDTPTEQLNMNYMYREKLQRDIDCGLTNIILVTESEYNRELNKNRSVNFSYHYKDYNNSFYSSGFVYEDMERFFYRENYQEVNIYNFIDKFYTSKNIFDYTNGFYELADDETIVKYNKLSFLGDETAIQNAINSATPLKIYVKEQYYDDNTYEYKYRVIDELKIVGYYKDLHCEFVISPNNHEVKHYENLWYSFDDEISTDEGYLSSTTLKGLYNSYYGYYYSDMDSWLSGQFGNFYIKGNEPFYDGTNFYQLKDNEVIMAASEFGSRIGSGQELYDAIDEGITIEIKNYYMDKDSFVTLKVVGVYEGYNSKYLMSEKTYNDYFASKVRGFDYSIAILSDNDKENEDFIRFCETADSNRVKYTVQNGSTPILDQFGYTIQSITEVCFYVGLGFAVFASVLLMNFISTSISYKRREIGILRALGARGSDVFGIFFNESVVIACINFLLATIATIVTCGILNNVIITDLGLDLVLMSVGVRQVGLIFGISILSAFLASLIPVIKISRKKPIDAINNR